MEIPKYHETYIPILKVLSDGKIIHYDEMLRQVRDQFFNDLPAELLNEKTKSGDDLVLNRIGWGKVYLKQAKMLQQPERGMVQITNKGQDALQKGILKHEDLLEDSDFLAHRVARKEEKVLESNLVSKDATPQDQVDAGIGEIERRVKKEILEKLKEVNPYYFEKVILKLFSKMGYGECHTTPKSADGGIDGIIYEDKLGLEKIYMQAKRYDENKVREKDIRNFIGAMSGDTRKGIFVTTSSFDESASKKSREAHHVIKLIDGEDLAQLMHDYGVGVQVRNTYEVKELDEDFFEES